MDGTTRNANETRYSTSTGVCAPVVVGWLLEPGAPANKIDDLARADKPHSLGVSRGAESSPFPSLQATWLAQITARTLYPQPSYESTKSIPSLQVGWRG